MEGTLSKFLKGFFLLSARQKLHFLNGECDTCLTKEWSMPVRTGGHVPLLTVYVVEKLYMNLVSMLETIRGNLYMLTAYDSLLNIVGRIQFPNKESTQCGQGVDGSPFQSIRITRLAVFR